MAYASQAQDLRHLLSVARKLRDIAQEALTGEDDRDLFLTAAAALEARAKWIATSLPGDRYDAGQAAHHHQPVNLLA